MGNAIEEEIKKEQKPIKIGQILVRVWDDGIVDARYFDINKEGRGPALKVYMEKDEFMGAMRAYVHDAMDRLVLPELQNYPQEASSEKPIIVGTATIDIYDDRDIVSVFTQIIRKEGKGAPRKNSALTEIEWKQALKSEVGNACDRLVLS